MSIDDFKKKRIKEEYAALRDFSTLEYNKCAAMASYISCLVRDEKKSELDIAAEVEAALVSYALRAVVAEDKIYELLVSYALRAVVAEVAEDKIYELKNVLGLLDKK